MKIQKLGFISLLFILACSSKEAATEKEAEIKTRTPVSVTKVEFAPISESIELNATTSFIRKNEVRSTSIGYIQKILVQLGERVHKGQTLFIIRTKESTALGNNLFPKDTSLQFSGIIKIKAGGEGFITSLNHQIGDYIQEGDSLATIVDQNSLVFMINVPFEWSKYVHIGLVCDIKIPGGRIIQGKIFQKVSIMDLGSQTQSYMVKIPSSENLPENLIAKVRIYKEAQRSSLSVPKSAILANEEETSFWVMKIEKDSLALKIPIQKGLENSDRVEILGNSLKVGDRVILEGNYGLPDSSIVLIQK